MQFSRSITAVLFLFLVTACASTQPPQPDPLKEEVATLQKQFLELQQIQNDTKAKLDESIATINALTSKIQLLEERQTAKPVSQPRMESDTANKAPAKKQAIKKKPAKKAKKKVRRQE